MRSFPDNGVLLISLNAVICIDQMISKRFLKTSFIYTIAGMLPMASATILLPFYITYLSTTDFGQLTVYYTLSLLVQVITTYSFDSSLYIHYHELKDDRPRLSSFISSAFCLMLLIGAGVTVVALTTGEIAFGVFMNGQLSFFPYGIISVVTGVLSSLFKVNSNLMQSRGEPEAYLWSNLIFFLLIAGFTVAGLYIFPGTLIGPVGGRMLACLIGGIWALGKIYGEFGFHFQYAELRGSFGYNRYLFIYQLLQWVINYFDRFVMLSFSMSLGDVGVYDLAFKCMLIIEFILNGLHNSFYPQVVSRVMAQETKGSTPEVNRYYHGFISVIMLLLCFSILIIPYAIQIIVQFGKNRQYMDAIEFLPYVGAIYVFRAMRLFFAAPYSILKYTKPLPFIYLFISILKVVLMILLIKQYGIYGVIIASLVSAFFEVVLLFFNARDRFNFRFNVFKIIVAPLSIVLLIVFIEPLKLFPQDVFVHVGYVVVCTALLWWVYRNELKLINPLKLFR
jgi:O-antigen/teichoic acid export membrane protein